MNKEIWKQLFTLQAEANNKLVGSEAWFKNSEKYDFVQCCLEEAIEAAASWGWTPWWKPAAELDMENVKLELIDILHFHMSAVMQQVSTMFNYLDPTPDEVIDKSVRHINYVSGNTPKVSNGTKLLQRYQQNLLTSGPIVAMHYLLDLFEAAGMSFDEAVGRYFAKNALNLFRAANGYKQNKAMKYWTEGKEDNAYVMELVSRLVDEGVPLDRDRLLYWIGVEYERVTGKTPA